MPFPSSLLPLVPALDVFAAAADAEAATVEATAPRNLQSGHTLTAARRLRALAGKVRGVALQVRDGTPPDERVEETESEAGEPEPSDEGRNEDDGDDDEWSGAVRRLRAGWGCRREGDSLLLETGAGDYDIPIHRCDTDQKVVWWVSHLSRKSWITAAQIGGFVALACGTHGRPSHGPC